MEKLPIELLPAILKQVVLLHLTHPRRPCNTLGMLADMRLVCRSFSEEIVRVLCKYITLPNISCRNPRLISRQYESHHPERREIQNQNVRNQIFASALFNSVMSTRNRLLCTGITSQLLNCVRIAAAAKTRNAPFIPSSSVAKCSSGVGNLDMRELMQLLCKAVVYTNYDRTSHAWYSNSYSRVGAADMHSTYSILGLALEYSSNDPNDGCTSRMPPNGFEPYDHGHRLMLDKMDRPSTLLGDPICCAILANRIDMVQYLLSLKQEIGMKSLDEDKIWVAYQPPYYIAPGLAARAINLSIQLQNVSMLQFLLRLEGPRNGGFGPVFRGVGNGAYGEEYGGHVVRAVVHGNIQIVEMLFDALADAWFELPSRYESEVSRLKQRGFRAAVISAQTEVVRWFVARGVDVNRAGALEETALEIAVRKGFVNIVKVLVEAGAIVKEENGMEDGKNGEGVEEYKGTRKTLYSRFVKALPGLRKETRMHAARGTKPHIRDRGVCSLGNEEW